MYKVFNKIKVNQRVVIIIIAAATILITIQPDQADFQLTQVSPDKVITPNGDGINDEINFTFDNPKESIVSGCIYDINGAIVADLIWGGDNTSLKWDGRSLNGNTVKEGIYIYQIKAESRIINGSVLVIK